MQVLTKAQLIAVVKRFPKFPDQARFMVFGLGPGDWVLKVKAGGEEYNLASTRFPALSRVFHTVEAVIKAAQAIADAAGFEPNHGWTGRAESRPCMPQVEVYLSEEFR